MPKRPRKLTAKQVEAKRRKLADALGGLEQMYGGPRTWKRRGSGLDVLVEAMLSQNTNMVNAGRGYRMLRRRFKSWTEVMQAPVGDVQRQIEVCGLARMRARRLQDLLRKIKADRGRLDLDFLRGTEPRAAYDYLMAFHGIGPKTAAFVLLFAFDQPVLPVDNGVLRVCKRLRLVRGKARDLETERLLSPLIAPGAHYGTHTLMFRHAKDRCRPKNPRCTECDLLKLCPYGQRRVKHLPPEELIELKPPGRMRPIYLSKFASDGFDKRRGDGEA